MSDLVSADKIEGIVGIARHPIKHYARAVSSEQIVYILHSRGCLDRGIDLRECRYSKALDRGIDELDRWAGYQDQPVRVMVSWGHLVPYDSMVASDV